MSAPVGIPDLAGRLPAPLFAVQSHRARFSNEEAREWNRNEPGLILPAFPSCRPAGREVEEDNMKYAIRAYPAARIRRCWIPGCIGLIPLALAVGALGRVSAHDLFTAYIQHRVHVTVGAKHVDLTVDLTFFEEWSFRERGRMDANTNGQIARVEVDEYLRRMAPEWAGQVRLLIGRQEVPLTTLYEPEVDLLGGDRAGPGHHRLRLFWFAPTPPGLRAEDVLVIEDRLWPEAKALGALQADGGDACRLDPEKPRDPAFAPAQSGEARVFKVKCLEPPQPQPAARKPSPPSS